jgi:hypothetical protein
LILPGLLHAGVFVSGEVPGVEVGTQQEIVVAPVVLIKGVVIRNRSRRQTLVRKLRF